MSSSYQRGPGRSGQEQAAPLYENPSICTRLHWFFTCSPKAPSLTNRSTVMLLLGLLVVISFSTATLFIVATAPTRDWDYFPGMSTTPCANDKSFRSGAAAVIGGVAFPAFAACVRDSAANVNATEGAINCGRNDEILMLRDSLNTLNFAYFPLLSSQITYNKVNEDGTTIKAFSHHPIEPLLYYTSRMYTGIGDEGDAALESDGGVSLSATSQFNVALFREVRALLSSPTLTPDSAVTWEDYFNNPGPKGAGSNTWSVPSLHQLYYSSKPLQSDEQFWRRGSRPRQTDTLLGAVGRLLRIQVADIRKRYGRLLATAQAQKPGAPRLWSSAILKSPDGVTFDNIDTFHKVRKVLRTAARVIEMYPDVLTSSSVVLPANVLTYLGIKKDGKKDGAVLTYKDALCLKGTVACPTRALSYLLTLDDRAAFPLTWWGLDESSYLALRALVLLRTSSVGSFQSESALPRGFLNRDRPGTPGAASFCPSAYYVDGLKPSATYVPPTPPPYAHPQLVDGKLGGTYCNVDKYMGDVHDAMVVYQKNEAEHMTPTIEQMGQYIQDVTRGIEEMLKDNTMIYSQLAGGLCKQVHPEVEQLQP